MDTYVHVSFTWTEHEILGLIDKKLNNVFHVLDIRWKLKQRLLRAVHWLFLSEIYPCIPHSFAK